MYGIHTYANAYTDILIHDNTRMCVLFIASLSRWSERVHEAIGMQERARARESESESDREMRMRERARKSASER